MLVKMCKRTHFYVSSTNLHIYSLEKTSCTVRKFSLFLSFREISLNANAKSFPSGLLVKVIKWVGLGCSRSMVTKKKKLTQKDFFFKKITSGSETTLTSDKL